MAESPDLDRLKQATAWMWSLGDYSAISPLLESCAIKLADLCEIRPGMKVLDVAAGNGNFAVAAAGRGAVVTACDLTPRMIELGRARTEAQGLDVEWMQADAEDLKFPDDQFDVVASVFGAMFAPRPEPVAAELFRVCQPGGTVAMANYAWGGFLGAYSKLLGRYSSRSSLDLPSPFEWGDPQTVRERFRGLTSELNVCPAVLPGQLDSADEFIAFWQRTNGPTVALKTMLEADRFAQFTRDAIDLVREMSEPSAGRLQLSSDYLNVIARKGP